MRFSVSTFPLALVAVSLVISSGLAQAQTEPANPPPPPLDVPTEGKAPAEAETSDKATDATDASGAKDTKSSSGATEADTKSAADGATVDYTDEAPDALDPESAPSDPSSLDNVEVAPLPLVVEPPLPTVPARPAPKSSSPYAVAPAYEENPVDDGAAILMPFDSAVLVPGLVGMGATMVLPAGAVAIGLLGVLGASQGWFNSNPNDACATFVLSAVCATGGAIFIGPAGLIGTNIGTGVGLGLAKKEWAPFWAGLATGAVTFGFGVAAGVGAWTLGSNSGGDQLLSTIFISALVGAVGIVAISGPASLVASLATEFMLKPEPPKAPLEAFELAVPQAPRVALPTRY